MKAGKLGLLSVALVFGLAACGILGNNNDDPSDPTDPTSPTDPTDPTDPTTPSGADPSDPTDPSSAGVFGVSESASGPFVYSGGDQPNIADDSDSRVISVADGGTFYAQVAVDADAPVESIDILLVNSEPEGIRGTLSTTPLSGFALVGEPTGSCDLGTSETVTCVYEISVAPGTPEIEDLPGAGDEFAYVFRHAYTVGGVQTVDQTYRGYVDIE